MLNIFMGIGKISNELHSTHIQSIKQKLLISTTQIAPNITNKQKIKSEKKS